MAKRVRRSRLFQWPVIEIQAKIRASGHDVEPRAELPLVISLSGTNAVEDKRVSSVSPIAEWFTRKRIAGNSTADRGSQCRETVRVLSRCRVIRPQRQVHEEHPLHGDAFTIEHDVQRMMYITRQLQKRLIHLPRDLLIL